MTLQLARPLAVLDLETTGVDVQKDRIVSLAIAVLSNDRAPDVQEQIFDPGIPISAEASAVHGVTDAMVVGKPRFVEAAGSIEAALAGADVAGFNVRTFDVPLLSAEMARAGIKWPGPGVRIVDAFRIYNRMEGRTLSSAVRHYLGREYEGAHGAAADVAACVEVLGEQARRYGARTLDALVQLQRDPDWIDEDGRFRWQGDVPVVGFGKWQGKPMSQVDRGYFNWICGQEFPDEVKRIAAAAARGQYPKRAAAPEARP